MTEQSGVTAESPGFIPVPYVLLHLLTAEELKAWMIDRTPEEHRP
jgi:hypothetical protein